MSQRMQRVQRVRHPGPSRPVNGAPAVAGPMVRRRSSAEQSVPDQVRSDRTDHCSRSRSSTARGSIPRPASRWGGACAGVTSAFEWSRRWLAEQWPEWQPWTRAQRSGDRTVRYRFRATDAATPPADCRRELVGLEPNSADEMDAAVARWVTRWSPPLNELSRQLLATVDRKLGTGDQGQALAAETASRFRRWHGRACGGPSSSKCWTLPLAATAEGPLSSQGGGGQPGRSTSAASGPGDDGAAIAAI